jgi:hypothetical protein
MIDAASDEEMEHSGNGGACTGGEVVDGLGAFTGFGVVEGR